MKDFYRKEGTGTRKLYLRGKKSRLVTSRAPFQQELAGVIRQMTSLVLIRWLLIDWYQIVFLGEQQATVHGVARVGHDLATKPPPPQKLIKSGFGDMGLGIDDFILGPLACFEQKSPPGPT